MEIGGRIALQKMAKCSLSTSGLPLVSIIIPAHNAESFVGEAIRSAATQLRARVEVIVVDDGSTDGTVVVAHSLMDEAAKQGVPLSVITQTQNGASAARNNGLQHAKGEFVQFLDADDYLSPVKVCEQVRSYLQHVESTGSTRALVYGPWRLQDETGGTMQVSPPRQSAPVEYQSRAEILRHFLSGWFLPSHSLIWPRFLLDVIGGWDETLHADQDGDIFFRAMCAGAELVYAGTAECVYRQHGETQISRRVSLASCESRFASLRRMEEQLRAFQMFEEMREALALRAYNIFETSVALYPHFAGTVRDYTEARFGYWPRSGSWRKRLFETCFGSKLTYKLINALNNG